MPRTNFQLSNCERETIADFTVRIFGYVIFSVETRSIATKGNVNC